MTTIATKTMKYPLGKMPRNSHKRNSENITFKIPEEGNLLSSSHDDDVPAAAEVSSNSSVDASETASRIESIVAKPAEARNERRIKSVDCAFLEVAVCLETYSRRSSSCLEAMMSDPVWSMERNELDKTASFVQKGVPVKEGTSLFLVDRVFLHPSRISPTENTKRTKSMYKKLGKPVLRSVLRGKRRHGTIFLLGPENCHAKTETLHGHSSKDSSLLYSLLWDLFRRTQTTDHVSISFLEVFQETVRDLLDTRLPVVALRDDGNGGVCLNCQQPRVQSAEQAFQCYRKAQKGRRGGHAIFQIHLVSFLQPAVVLNLVDLVAGHSGGRSHQSLLSLSQVVQALGLPPRRRPRHMNYRDSKLTRILQPYFGDDTSKAFLSFANAADLEETRTALRFAHRARKMRMVLVGNKTKAAGVAPANNAPSRSTNLIQDEAELAKQTPKNDNKLRRQKPREKNKVEKTPMLAKEELQQEQEKDENKQGNPLPSGTCIQKKAKPSIPPNQVERENHESDCRSAPTNLCATPLPALDSSPKSPVSRETAPASTLPTATTCGTTVEQESEPIWRIPTTLLSSSGWPQTPFSLDDAPTVSSVTASPCSSKQQADLLDGLAASLKQSPLVPPLGNDKETSSPPLTFSQEDETCPRTIGHSPISKLSFLTNPDLLLQQQCPPSMSGVETCSTFSSKQSPEVRHSAVPRHSPLQADGSDAVRRNNHLLDCCKSPSNRSPPEETDSKNDKLQYPEDDNDSKPKWIEICNSPESKEGHPPLPVRVAQQFPTINGYDTEQLAMLLLEEKVDCTPETIESFFPDLDTAQEAIRYLVACHAELRLEEPDEESPSTCWNQSVYMGMLMLMLSLRTLKS